jgi:hypothetical protein
MIGFQELIIPILIIAAVAIFGRGIIKKLIRDVFGAKKDFEEIKQEFAVKKE